MQIIVNNNNCLFVMPLFTDFAKTMTITRQLFDRSLQRRSSNRDYSLHTAASSHKHDWTITITIIWKTFAIFSNTPHLTQYWVSNKNCLTDLFKGNFQTTITLFRRTAYLHKTDWTSPTDSPALPCFAFYINSLMNVLEASINVNIIVSLLLVVYLVYIQNYGVCCYIFV